MRRSVGCRTRSSRVSVVGATLSARSTTSSPTRASASSASRLVAKVRTITPSVHNPCLTPPAHFRSGRRPPLRYAQQGCPGCAPRRPDVHPAVQRRPDRRDALDQRRPRLPRRRPRARLAEGLWPRGVRRRDGRAGAARLPDVHAARRHHPWYVASFVWGSNSLMRVIVVALESSHAVWEAVRLAKTLPKEAHIVVVRPVLLDIACSSRFSISVLVWSWGQRCGANLTTAAREVGGYPRLAHRIVILACKPSRYTHVKLDLCQCSTS